MATETEKSNPLNDLLANPIFQLFAVVLAFPLLALGAAIFLEVVASAGAIALGFI